MDLRWFSVWDEALVKSPTMITTKSARASTDETNTSTLTGGLFRRPEVYKPIGLVSPRGRPSTNCTDSTLLTRERGDARGDGILGLVCETVAYATDFEDRRVRPMESCGALTATVNGPSRLNGEYTFRTALLVCAGDTGASTVVVALLRVPGKNMEANTCCRQ